MPVIRKGVAQFIAYYAVIIRFFVVYKEIMKDFKRLHTVEIIGIDGREVPGLAGFGQGHGRVFTERHPLLHPVTGLEGADDLGKIAEALLVDRVHGVHPPPVVDDTGSRCNLQSSAVVVNVRGDLLLVRYNRMFLYTVRGVLPVQQD